MGKSKRGISPLIATVLIIGFTIVLGAMVMQWGTAFFKSTTEQTGKTSSAQISCTQVGFSFDSATLAAGNLQLTLTNKVDMLIPSFIVRLIKGPASTTPGTTTLLTWPASTSLNSFETKTVSIASSTAAAGDSVEVIPKVQVGTDQVACSLDYKQAKTI